MKAACRLRKWRGAGEKTLLFGPMKPVGLERPDGSRPYAVVQLRQDNAAASMYNVVGFQTHLKWPEQRRILRMIPGLENCEILRYGVMHRNSYINSPLCLRPTYQTVKREDLFFAGQMTGVEGYIESAASGLNAGLQCARLVLGLMPEPFPQTCMIGAMAHYITHADPKHFQPMNANFGILPLVQKVKKERTQGSVWHPGVKRAGAVSAVAVMEHEVTPEEAAKKQLMSVADEFVEFIVARRSGSPATADSYGRDLERFAAYLAEKRLRISVRSTKR